jgi:hypothetical protein
MKRLSVTVAASIVLLAGFAKAPAAGAAVQSYTGCLSPILNAVYDVTPGDSPAHGCVRPAAAIHLSSGDVTSLAAGIGLTGGGDNGDVSLALAPSYRLPQACTNGQTAAWNGTAWACSSGTTYSAGAGLNLSGQTFSVDPTQVQNRITGSCPAGSSIRAIAQNGTVTCEGQRSYTAGEGLTLNGSEFSLSFDPTTQAEFNAYSQLLSQPGTTNDAGNPVDWTKLKNVPAGFADGVDNESAGGLGGYCAHVQTNPASFPDAPCRARIATVDTAGDVGSFSSLAIGTDGNPVISYFETGGNGDFMVAHCNDPICSGGDETRSLVDFVGSVGRYTSIAIGADGNPVVSYYDATHGDLKVARCNDPACADGGETVSTVDATGDAGLWSSIAIGTDGNPVIAYQDQELGLDRFLKVVRCNDPACTGGDEVAHTVASDDAGAYASLAIGADGNPVISYQGGAGLSVAKCNDADCAGGNEAVSLVDGFGIVGSYTSLGIGTDGNPVISYTDSTFGELKLKVARCNDPACEGGDETVSFVDAAGDSGAFTSLAIGTDGNPVISYQDGTNADLKLAHCNDPACAGGNEALSTVDAPGSVGTFTSVAIGTDGNPVISYHDATNGDLKVARPAVTG